MQTLSNNEDFVQAIKSLKNKARKLKTPRKETPYRYIIATEQNKVQFLTSMRQMEEEEDLRVARIKELYHPPYYKTGELEKELKRRHEAYKALLVPFRETMTRVEESSTEPTSNGPTRQQECVEQ